MTGKARSVVGAASCRGRPGSGATPIIIHRHKARPRAHPLAPAGGRSARLPASETEVRAHDRDLPEAHRTVSRNLRSVIATYRATAQDATLVE